MKFTKQEKSWILYDVANSAFVLLLSSTVPIYFRALGEQGGLADSTITSIFSLATSVSVLFIAFLGPILGAIADHKGMKKKLFTLALLIGLLGGFSISVTQTWQAFLFMLVLARIGYSLCNVFYDSMLTDVTTNERMDSVSGAGFAYGYVGSTIPFILGITLVLTTPFGLSTMLATQISFLITIVWWFLLSIPLLRDVKQTHYKEKDQHMMKNLGSQLVNTVKKIRNNKHMMYFLLGYFCYIDGVNTIISQSASFGGEVGLDGSTMIIALLMTQFVAFPFAVLSGKLSAKFGQLNMLKFYIGIYIIVACVGFVMTQAWQFWLLAFMVGIAQGGIQSLSRSYFGKLVPKQESNEYFGFFDIFGKFAEFLGPLLMVLSVSMFGQSKYGILALIVLFALGLYFIRKIEKLDPSEKIMSE